MLFNNKLLFIVIILNCLFQTGCHIYRLDIRQGNEIEQTKLDQLKANLSKEEVQKIIGTANLDSGNPNRLDYYFYLSPNGDKVTKQQHITFFFDNRGKLNHYTSDNKDLFIRSVPKKAK